MDNDKQMDYHGLIIGHLNRLSFVTTSNFIDMVNPAVDTKYENAPSTGETSLSWGTQFLHSIMPDDMLDNTYFEEMKKLREAYKLQKTDSPNYNFKKLKIMINLLNRRGLLIQTKVIGRKMKKEQTEGVIAEEFEE